ncbi:IclR family transcriptional regulator [Gordonia insulae]|nr:IclR family transcriptional regulator [Gordonia insulae]
MDVPAPSSGVIARASAVLTALSRHEPDGSTTSVLAREASLPRATTHRLLADMAEAGLIDRDVRNGRWHLGSQIYLLGTVAATRYDIVELARDSLVSVARETGESAYLSTRQGDETVCVATEEGSFPLRSHVLQVGTRFPLGVASAGLAILAHLPKEEQDRVIAAITPEPTWRDPHDGAGIRRRIARTRRTGYAENPGLIVEGSWGLGAAVFDSAGNPLWALSITGVQTRFGRERLPRLGRLLMDEAHNLTKRLG